MWAGIAQSVWRLDTGWTVRGSNSGEGEIFGTSPVLPWVKRPGCDVAHTPLSSTEVKEFRYLCSSYGPAWAVPGWTSLSYTECPTTYQTRQFFNNSKTNEDIATRFEHEYVRCVRNEKECVCSKIMSVCVCSKIIKELPGLVGSGTPYT